MTAAAQKGEAANVSLPLASVTYMGFPSASRLNKPHEHRVERSGDHKTHRTALAARLIIITLNFY